MPGACISVLTADTSSPDGGRASRYVADHPPPPLPQNNKARPAPGIIAGNLRPPALNTTAGAFVATNTPTGADQRASNSFSTANTGATTARTEQQQPIQFGINPAEHEAAAPPPAVSPSAETAGIGQTPTKPAAPSTPSKQQPPASAAPPPLMEEQVAAMPISWSRGKLIGAGEMIPKLVPPHLLTSTCRVT
jgi:hypothetical protein